MKTVLDIALVIHIICGFVSLVVAPLAMITKKGGKSHKSWGKIYFVGMTGVAITGVFISILKSIPFLLMVSVFSYYFVAYGYRIIYLKNLHKDQKPTRLDWEIAIVTGLFNIGLICFGIYQILNQTSNSFSYIAIVFGIVGIQTVYSNSKLFWKKPTDPKHWFYSHIGGMVGSYIATVSAFSATNFYFLPTVLRWLWPTILGVPLIIFWIKHYKNKFNSAQKGEN
ncbi:MAG: DUF2306 domain-containing protein [Calditrichaeota bacterium]|nr:MAG: DUF2306 domain-containing protein [Calditrichota bacterium]